MRNHHHLFVALILLGTLVTLGALPASAQPDPAYWHPDAIEAQLDAWQADHPDLVQPGVLGFSGQGRPILMATITSAQGRGDTRRPRLLFQASQHANEGLGTVAIMKQIATLLAGYGSDSLNTARLDSLELIFIPVLNPDGYHLVHDGHPSWEGWRKTLRDNDGDGEVDFPGDGVDLNRNWDWYWAEAGGSDPGSQKYKGPYPFSEPEAVAVRDWVLDHRPLLIIDYHSPVTITWTDYIFWPWMSMHGDGFSPDEPIARNVASTWAAATLSLSGQPYGSIFAYDTLPKQQCWIYGNTGILTFLMEIGQQCWYTGADVDTIAARVARGSTVLLDRALNGPGVRGRVTDQTTGAPLAAEVQIAQLHSDYVGPRLCESAHGTFQRLTRSGDLTLTVLHDGYQPQTVPVTAPVSGWTEVHVELQPILTAVDPAAGATADDPWFRGDRRIRAGQAIRLALPSGLPPARCELFDIRGRRLDLLAAGLVAGREHGLRLPGRLAGGVYLLRTTAGKHRQVTRLVCVD